MAKASISPQDLFVVRTLSIAGSAEKVRVEVALPKYVSENEAVCAYRFICGDEIYGHDIHGLDAFQALYLALKLLPTSLRHDGTLPLGKMYWLEEGDDMGFPETEWPKYPGDLP
jgi:hypothetical protein